MNTQEEFALGSVAFETNDYMTAVAHLLPLAIAGHMESQYLVAEMYRWGHGVSQHPEESIRFYKAAADQGHGRAAFDLFFLLVGGTAAPTPMQSLPKNTALSKHYLDIAVWRFKELAEAGDVDAMCHLGLLYHHGIGVELDGAEAIRWYSNAFENGFQWASNGLCLAYYEGDPRVRDKEKARSWYMKTKEFNCQNIGINEFEAAGISRSS